MEALKPIRWISSSKQDLSQMPLEIRRDVGYALYAAQQGDKHADAKVLKGFGGSGVLEIVARYDGETYRAVYSVRFADVIYVLHAFQKKSKRGIATPGPDLALVKARIKAAAADYAQRTWTKT